MSIRKKNFFDFFRFSADDNTLYAGPAYGTVESRSDRRLGADSGDSKFRVLSYLPTLTIDPKGTLTLILGDEASRTGPRSVIVSPHVLRRLSQKWEEVVNKDSKNVWKTPGRKQLRLTKENPDVLVQLLRIAHSEFGDLADKLTFRQIVQLAEISERYETNKILIPFLAKWTDPYRQAILEPGNEEWLFVAYQFGFEEDYLRLAKHLTLTCHMGKNGTLNGPSDKPLMGVFPKGSVSKWAVSVSFC